MRRPADDVVRLTTSGDPERCRELLPLALALVRRTQERMRVGGLAQLSSQERFGRDAYAYAVIAGGVSAVHIVADARASDMEQESERTVDTPDFLSGAVRNGYIVEIPEDPPRPAHRTLRSFHPSQACALRFVMPLAYQDVDRLAVEPDESLANELENAAENGIVFSQYTKLRPTLFSGTMRHLVQVLLGFGKPSRQSGQPSSIYDRKGKAREAPHEPSARDRRTARSGLQVAFDWHFSRTHGITFGADGRPWLVEIGTTQGVMAMPLPLRVETTTAEFRARLDKAADAEALEVVDRYGGFPTGEGFPPSDEIDAWVRAGRILRLVSDDDMAPFYAYSPYSNQLGWAFNLAGDEAHHTAWRFGDDGIQRGVHFMVPLQIGATDTGAERDGAQKLKSAFGKDLDATDGDVKAAIWKAGRLSEFEMRWALSALDRSVDEAFTYVDGLVLAPIAPSAAHLSKVSEGTLWYPPTARIENGQIMRFPEPALGVLVAHSMKPAGTGIPAPALCDTTVHVFFAGNELKWVKFYRDSTAGAGPGNSSDFETCMFIGQWSQHADGGNRTVPAMFYTNDLDDRDELAPSTSDTRVVGLDLGYSGIQPSDSIVNPSVGTARRTKRFREKTETTVVHSPGLGTGIAVPFFEREAYFYAIQHTHAGIDHSISYSYKYLTDPWYCTYKRNFPGYFGTYRSTYDSQGNFTGWMPVRLSDVNGYGPNEYRTADPNSPLYDDSNGCRDIADSGPWAKGGDNIDVMSYSIPEPPLPAATNESTPATGVYDVWLVSSSNQGALKVSTHSGLSFGLWSLWTPDLGDGFSADQYIEATQNVAGMGNALRCNSDLNDSLQVRGAPVWPGLESGSLTFIGVVNG